MKNFPFEESKEMVHHPLSPSYYMYVYLIPFVELFRRYLKKEKRNHQNSQKIYSELSSKLCQTFPPPRDIFSYLLKNFICDGNFENFRSN